ncbi:MAG: 30S ribosomal protein S20 [Petrimonas sp.]|jgi:small subunit ribosomal protein S20|nr:30S ribosomal protein S20 [Petrimonas sp.]
MANIKSAIKRNKQSIVRNARNRAYKSAVLTAAKKVGAAIESGDKENAVKEFSEYTSKLDKACKRGVLPKNTVSRRKSRIAARIAKMA